MANELEEAQYYIFVTQVFFCCMYAVVLWDWIVSLPREWRFIWKTEWSIVKGSYLFCRYWVILVMPYVLSIYLKNYTVETCQKVFKAPVALALWNQAGAEVVLLIRTYAFYNRNRYLLVVLCTGLTTVIMYQIYVAANEMLLLPFVAPPFLEGPCLPMSKPHSAHILGFFMASLAFDAIVTTLTLIKAFRMRRDCGATSNPLIQTFLREGVFYFVLISFANLANGIFYLQRRAVMSAILIPLSIMFPDILACRLILDLRQRGFEISQPTTLTMQRQGVHRSLPLHLVDGCSRSTMFDSMPSQHTSKVSFPPGTLALTSLPVRSQTQWSSSDVVMSPAPGFGRRSGYGPLSTKSGLSSTSMPEPPVLDDLAVEKDGGVDAKESATTSVESVAPELPLKELDLEVKERHVDLRLPDTDAVVELNVNDSEHSLLDKPEPERESPSHAQD